MRGIGGRFENHADGSRRDEARAGPRHDLGADWQDEAEAGWHYNIVGCLLAA